MQGEGTHNAGLKRHTLLDIRDDGRERILAELTSDVLHDDPLRKRYEQVVLAHQAGARVPAIVRREEKLLAHEMIPVGFSSPCYGSEGRLRIAAFARAEEIVQVTTPYDLLAREITPPRNSCTTALGFCRESARVLGLVLGVWGSVALELYTGMQYTHDGSDLDLLVAAAPREILAAFLSKITAIENHFGLRIDAEVDLASGYGVHLKELFGSGRTILGKSQTDVVLLSRDQVLAELLAETARVPYREQFGGVHG